MTATPFAYRDALEGDRIRYAELLAERSLGPSLSGVSRVFAARTGRIWAGTTGIAGAAWLVLATRLGIALTPILLLSWPAMLGAYAIGWALGMERGQRADVPPATGDLRTDLARLAAAPPVADFRDLAAGHERRSMSLPMIAVALLAPLTIHAVVASSVGVDTTALDHWIAMSLVIVGHAHLALAWRYHQFACDAALFPGEELAIEGRHAQVRALGTVVLVSAVPGALLLLLPPILTMATALLFNPLLFWGMTRTIVAERRALA